MPDVRSFRFLDKAQTLEDMKRFFAGQPDLF